jgi:hypothetical protein
MDICGSAPHSLLATGRVDAAHPDLATDPLGILRPPSKLCHSLPLVCILPSEALPLWTVVTWFRSALKRGCLFNLRQVNARLCLAVDQRHANWQCVELLQTSAYSALGRMNGVGPMLDRQRWHVDPSSDEPFFTNCTRDFLGTLDYIFYTGDYLYTWLSHLHYVIVRLLEVSICSL